MLDTALVGEGQVTGPLTMPAFAQLKDAEIADILNFARKSWGRADAREIHAKEVQSMRKQLDAKGESACPFETPRLAAVQASDDRLLGGQAVVEI